MKEQNIKLEDVLEGLKNIEEMFIEAAIMFNKFETPEKLAEFSNKLTDFLNERDYSLSIIFIALVAHVSQVITQRNKLMAEVMGDLDKISEEIASSIGKILH
jgi:sulfatase maturation enzyme AslB (radical SAM superfamily)